MKRNSHSHDFDPKMYESFESVDTRYYGVFIKGRGETGRILVDPKRFQKFFGILPEEVKTVMDKRQGPFFRPAKKHIADYNVNYMLDEFARIRRWWDETNKPMIDRFLSEICGKTYIPADSDLYTSGILDHTEAATYASMRTWCSQAAAEAEQNNVYYSLYAQFFHQLASQMEALFLKTLTRNGYKRDRFDRNVLYTFKSSNQESVRTLEGFVQFDKMYAIWNFIKHNSLSTFTALKDRFPEVLQEGNYTQGELACFWIKFDDNLVDGILDGLAAFIKEYCHLVFKEDAMEARWNSDEHFLDVVHGEIEAEQNPLGLPWWT